VESALLDTISQSAVPNPSFRRTCAKSRAGRLAQTLDLLALGNALVLIGLFLWFALAFNVTVGETFVNYSFFVSALLIVIAGVMKNLNRNFKFFQRCCSIALVLYLPMI
jgi:hypothetical protein